MIYPETLKEGDKVAIISPASVVNPVFIDSAAAYIGQNGFEPVVMPHAKGPACGSYAASVQDRLSDLLSAWQMPDVRVEDMAPFICCLIYLSRFSVKIRNGL